MTEREIAEFLGKLLSQNSYSDWVFVKKELEEQIFNYEEEIINKDPYLLASQRPARLGYCKKCNLYVSLISYDSIDYFCRDCFLEIYEKPWKDKRDQKLKELREQEYEKSLKTRFERRHAKGLCPLNLRH